MEREEPRPHVGCRLIVLADEPPHSEELLVAGQLRSIEVGPERHGKSRRGAAQRPAAVDPDATVDAVEDERALTHARAQRGSALERPVMAAAVVVRVAVGAPPADQPGRRHGARRDANRGGALRSSVAHDELHVVDADHVGDERRIDGCGIRDHGRAVGGD